MSSFILRLEHQQKRFLKIHFESAYFSFFLTHVELKQYIRSYIPVARLKSIPDSRSKCAKSIPVFRLKRRKNPTLWRGTYPNGLCKGVPLPWGEEGEPLPRGEE